MLALALFFLGFASRLIVHTPNFSPVIALALFGGVYLGRRYALALPVVLMMASDIFLGAHATMPFTWGSVLLISALGIWLKSRQSVLLTTATSLSSSLIFFVITNFGCWLDMYPLTVQGLTECYALAIPFYRTMVWSTLIYAALLFGAYELIALRVRKTRWAPVLLTA